METTAQAKRIRKSIGTCISLVVDSHSPLLPRSPQCWIASKRAAWSELVRYADEPRQLWLALSVLEMQIPQTWFADWWLKTAAVSSVSDLPQSFSSSQLSLRLCMLDKVTIFSAAQLLYYDLNHFYSLNAHKHAHMSRFSNTVRNVCTMAHAGTAIFYSICNGSFRCCERIRAQVCHHKTL